MSKKEKKPKKDTNPYDENGVWKEKKTRIKGAIRRVFRLSPQMKEVLEEARVELPPALKKDGTPGKKNQVRYRCALCSGLFSKKWVQVDHIEPVVFLWRSESDMTVDELADRIICHKSNLQVVCSTPLAFLPKGAQSCHRKKTNEENFIREELMKFPESERPFLVEQARGAYASYLAEKTRVEEEKLQRKLDRLNKKKKKEGQS